MHLPSRFTHPVLPLASLLLVGALALSGCSLLRPAQVPTETPAPAATDAPTSAPATTAAPLPSNTAPPASTATRAATATLRPSATSEAGATEGTPPNAATATSAVTGTVAAETPAAGTAVPAGVDKAEFVSDVTVPDGTDFTPGQAFVKTWRLRNSGTTTWTVDYQLAFIRGAQMGAPAAVPLSGTVAPGQTADISVNMIAPTALGNQVAFWQLQNAQGVLFGGGAEANEPVYVQIDVVPAGSTPGAVSTGAPGSLSVTSTNISIDRASATGTCPQTFRITTSFTSQGAGTVTYRLEASSSTPGFTFNLPEAFDSPFNDAGPRTFAVPYSLEFSNSVTGEAWLHITAPQEITSDRVSFSLTCEAAANPTTAATATP
jgi:hypothetical protein